MLRILFFIVCAAISSVQTALANPSYEHDLDQDVVKILESWHVPGASLAIIQDDKVVLAKGYGVRALDSAKAVNADTVFEIGSCTKAFTSAALASLVGEKKIDWDDPVITYLPTFVVCDPYITSVMSVRDLLSMRTGLDRNEAELVFANFTRQDIMNRLRYQRPVIGFRAGFTYVNQMYVAAGEVLQAVSHQSWDDYVQKHILSPLKMTNTYITNRDIDKLANVAQSYHFGDDKLVQVARTKIDMIAPAGSICSTANDMTKWMRLQLKEGNFEGKQLINSEALAETHKPQTVVDVKALDVTKLKQSNAHFAAYCMGWCAFDYNGKLLLLHTGGIDGMRAQVMLMPEEKLGLAVLTNCDYGDGRAPTAINMTALDHVLKRKNAGWSNSLLSFQKAGDESTKALLAARNNARVVNTHPTVALDQYAGTYTSDLLGDMEVIAAGPSLLFKPPAKEACGAAAHWNYDTFIVKWDDPIMGESLITFNLNEFGKPASLTIPDVGLYRRK